MYESCQERGCGRVAQSEKPDRRRRGTPRGTPRRSSTHASYTRQPHQGERATSRSGEPARTARRAGGSSGSRSGHPQGTRQHTQRAGGQQHQAYRSREHLQGAAGPHRDELPNPTDITPRSESSRRRRDSRLRRIKREENSRTSFPFIPVIAIVAALLVGFLAYFASTGGFSNQGGQDEDPLAAEKAQELSCEILDSTKVFTSAYNWDRLGTDDNGHFVYVQGGEIVSRVGIDVSEHNGTIDWDAVAGDGIEFAYLRIGYRGTVEGNITADKQFEDNLSGARGADLDIGVYFFSQAINEDEAREEADWVIERLGDFVPTYPIVFDMEASTTGGDRIANLTNDQATAIAVAFCKEIESEGYQACVYGSRADLARYDLSKLYKYGFWYAEYADQPTMALRYGIWQYTNSAEVDGIDGDVDLDLDLTSVLAEVQEKEATNDETTSSASES